LKDKLNNILKGYGLAEKIIKIMMGKSTQNYTKYKPKIVKVISYINKFEASIRKVKI